MRPLVILLLTFATLACGPPSRGDRGETDHTESKPDAGECKGTPCGGGCCGTGLVCVDGACEACVPACDGLACGGDGCGGSCGTCEAGFCNDGVCDLSCEPACVERQCGPDGCGGTCGTCSGTQSCNASGVCVAACTPTCNGRQCGPDGCGGTCGTCSDTQSCNASGVCVAACTPTCNGRQCGPDGCGGTCGSCGTDTSCNASGQCVRPQPQWATLGNRALSFATSAYDPVRRSTYVYGGETNAARCRSETVTCIRSDAMLELRNDNLSTWTPTPRPTARFAANLAYDPVGDRIVLHSGLNESGLGVTAQGDIWQWTPSTATWTSTWATDTPAAVGAFVATAPGRFELFAGYENDGFSLVNTNKLWRLENQAFTARPSASMPSARGEFAFAWHATEQRLYLFGGFVGSALVAETWYLDASGWHQSMTTGGPTARYGARMVWDPDGDRILMFGGCQELGSTTLGDLWALDAGVWTRLSVATNGVSPRCQHVFERMDGGFLLLGGLTQTPTGIADVTDAWELSFGAAP